MSVVLDRPFVGTRLQESDVPLFLRQGVRTEPQQRPVVDAPIAVPVPARTPVQTPARIRRRSDTHVGQLIAVKTMLFVGFFAATYVTSTLAGHYMVEKSRNLGIEATNRAAVAVQAERDVQRRLDVLTSASSIEDWALSHGFRPTDGLGQTSRVVNLVASSH